MTEAVQSGVDEERLTRGYTGRMLILFSSCALTAQLGWLVLPPLLDAIMDDLAITATQAGIGLTLLTGLAAIGRYPGGRLADQWSRKTVVAFSLLAMSGGFFVLSGVTNYPMFLLGTMLVGIGLGTFVPSTYAQLSDMFVHKRGRAYGVVNAAFNLGGVLASGAAVVALALGSWRLAFVPIVVMLLSLLVLLHRWSRESYVVTRPDLEIRETVTRLLLEPRILVIMIVAALVSFVWNGSISFLPVFLETERGLAGRTATAAYAAVFVTGVLVTPVAGAVGDRIGSLRTVMLTISATIVGLGVVVFSPTPAFVFLGIVCFAIGLTGFWPVMTSFMMNVFPEESKGGDYGAIGTVYMAAGSIGPTYVGSLGDRFHFTGAYIGLIACLVLALGLVVWIRSR